MKHTTLLSQLPDWYRWSDGTPLTHTDAKKFKVLERNKETCRLKHESRRQWFDRTRDLIERYETTKKKVVVKRPGVIARAIGWLCGRPAQTKLEVRL
jgi:ketosteroid isomerase-like protein